MTALLSALHPDDRTERAVRSALQRAGVVVRPLSPDAPDLPPPGTRLVVVVAGTGVAERHELCARVHAGADVPVVLLAASPHERDELLAFAAGCDDYIRTPCSDLVVAVRLQARLRRAPAPAEEGARLGSVFLDRAARRVAVGDREVPLTRTEFELLQVLLENPRHVLTRQHLLERVWQGCARDDHVLEVHLSRLRAKVLRAGGPFLGQPVPGVGYRAVRADPETTTPRPSD
ncbi:hypothetical protein GCM10009584_30800 [Ornithinimicrobium humiphilum]|uniref:DNA-binding response OmpR family regulator n=1 Tax=Ornithinimicrobium humiphilum TaxID=125288 RepID=A0A543K6V1_9MICO|nr:response regulator transcription factor [Ornithinimicrobium humiphilum]TQM90806.1 DNA-binding response OmpR family regulator [Ornithinimicrobium humiphilum]